MSSNALLFDFNKGLNTSMLNFQTIQNISNSITNTTNSINSTTKNIISKTNNITNATNNIANNTKNVIENVNIQINNTFQAMEKISDEVSKVKAPRSLSTGLLGKISIPSVTDTVKKAMRLTDQFNNNNLSDDVSKVKAPKSSSGGLLGKISMSSVVDTAKKGMSLTDQFNNNNTNLEALTANPLGMTDPIANAQLQKIYSAAQRSKGSYTDMVGSVGNLDKDTFKNTDEMVAFAELAQKSFKLNGGSQEQQQAGMNGLTQSMSDGVIGANEYKSITDSSPMIAQAMQSYTGKTGTELEQMAAKGLISSNIMKNALFGAADDINSKFQRMPGTFEDIWTTITNVATKSGADIMSRIGDFLKSDTVIAMLNGLTYVIGLFAKGILYVLDVAIAVADYVVDNWSAIKPMVYGIIGAIAAYQIAMAAVTVAQWLFNAATSPMIIIAVILGVIIALVYYAVDAFGACYSATGIIIGALAVVAAGIANIFLGLVKLVLGIIEVIYNEVISFANFFGNIFNDPITTIIKRMGDMGDEVLGIFEKIAQASDLVFRTHMADTVSQWRIGLATQVDDTAKRYSNESYDQKYNKLDTDALLKKIGVDFQGFDYKNAYDKGYNLGEKIDNFKMPELGIEKLNFGQSPYMPNTDELNNNVTNIANNTGSMSETMEISEEDLKYLRDAAEMEVINKFTTSSIKVNMTNNNAINNSMDLDGIVSHLENSIYESMSTAAEGVHDV